MTETYRNTVGFLLLAFCLVLTVAAESRQVSKPVVTAKIDTEYFGPPETLKDMVLQADAVVVATIRGKKPTSDNPTTRLRTALDMRIVEVLQAFGGQQLDHKQVTVIREGGERDEGTHVKRVIDAAFPPMDPTHR